MFTEIDTMFFLAGVNVHLQLISMPRFINTDPAA
jgi:hypothetical protein